MSERQAYFQALGDLLEAEAADRQEPRAQTGESLPPAGAAREKAASECVPRDLVTTAHAGALAVSWQIDLDYLRACTYRRETDRAMKQARTSFDVPRWGSRERGDLAAKAHARFQGLPEKTMRVECYIFFKDDSVPPQTNDGMAPAFGRAFHDAPLHTHFAIWRMQRPNPSTGEVEFTDWYAFQGDNPRTAEAVKDTFFAETVFKACPRPPGARFPWHLVAPAAIGGAALLAVLAIAFSDQLGIALPRERAELEARLDQLREDVVIIREQYRTETRFVEAYQNELVRLRESGASWREIEELERALESSQVRVDRLNRQLADAGLRLANAGGAGLPACWSDQRGRPAYLFEAYLDGRGIRLDYAEGAQARGRDEALPVHALPLGTALTIDSFLEATRPVFAAADSATPRCRHYVVLREGVHSSASEYQAQRAAVEQHFYIFRP